MGLWDSDKTLKRVTALEKGAEKLAKSDLTLIEQISSLRNSVAESVKRSPEYEKEAKQASKKASEFRNKASETLDEIIALSKSVKTQKDEISIIQVDLIVLKEGLESEFEEVRKEKAEINLAKEGIFSQIESIQNRIAEIQSVYDRYPDLSKNLDDLNNFYNQVEENFNKSGQLLKSITTRKNEIDNIHREIYGFEQEGEEGEEATHIPGLKDELEVSYDKLEKQLTDLSKQISDLAKDTGSKYAMFLEASKKSNSDLAEEWENKHSEINQKIQNLLPNALTAGLSHAFSKKKEDEDTAYGKHKIQFGLGIMGLICVSAIPFILSIMFLNEGKDWDVIIDRAPRIVLAIVPLYLPVLWLAFSSNKKMNLSKRLIEEYSHKEVLSKTFEGLSSQINSLEDNEISSELRIKLLQDFMQVYSENPGKLISNYETSDHPIMEVLDQSYKLESAIEKLKKIPGLQKVSKILEEKSESILEKGEKVVEQGLENYEKLENEETA